MKAYCNKLWPHLTLGNAGELVQIQMLLESQDDNVTETDWDKILPHSIEEEATAKFNEWLSFVTSS